jgi:GNAT superfamily N-acetyltransferase
MCRPGYIPGAAERHANVTGTPPGPTATRDDPSIPAWHTITDVVGHPVGIRPLDSNDPPRLLDALQHLSPTSRRQRFLSTIGEYTPDRVEQLTATAREGRYALVAVLLDHPHYPIIALAEFATAPDTPRIAEPAIAVLDAYQGHRLGTLLWHMLLDAAHHHGVTQFTGTLQASNTAATRLLQHAGARLCLHTPGVLRATLDIPAPATSPRRPSARARRHSPPPSRDD